MKKYLKLIIIAILFINIGCDSWLDINPTEQIVEEELFKTCKGLRTAVNGLYMSMASNELYGKELSFGAVDVLSQQYKINKNVIQVREYLDLFEYKYNTINSLPVIEKIWANAYNAIANANNIIEKAQNFSNDFYEKGELEKKMIVGEAKAVRAYLHFDLLRLFAPSVDKDDNKAYIPYVTQYGDLRPNGISVSKCLENIISDLEEAKELTMAYDTTEMGLSAQTDEKSRFWNEHKFGSYFYDHSGEDASFSCRGARLNYYAINALLARVYQYVGEHDKALEYAENVIGFKQKSGWSMFSWNTWGIAHNPTNDAAELASAWENKYNLKLLKNIIFACHDAKLHEDSRNKMHFRKSLSVNGMSYGPNYLVIDKDRQGIFNNKAGEDESDVDYRYKYLIYHAHNGNYPISGKWYLHEDDSKKYQNFDLIPMIRLTEMFYIAAESYARAGNFDEAKSYLEFVRSKRGCSGYLDISNMDEFEEELVRDASREFISEGQLFYLLKRLDYSVKFGDGSEVRKFKANECVVPIPDNQSI